MINLLPPALKEQVRYAKLNRLAMRYLRVMIVVLLVLAGIFVGTIFYLNLETKTAQADVTRSQQQITNTAAFQKEARAVADRLASIKYVQGSQTRFSLLLGDLAKVLPKGVSIDSITLTGNDKLPVRIAVTASSYDQVLAFREAFAQSPRISGVDLENITQSASGFQAAVIIGFKPGQAK
jgi:Tfp pilus assembly protein PilN